MASPRRLSRSLGLSDALRRMDATSYMKSARKASLLIAAFAFASCIEAGGGGAVHHSPSSIKRGVPTPLELELSAVNPHGSMSRRMTSITCHYRLSGSSAFTSVPMTPADVDSRHLIARCSLPPFPPDAHGSVEYYFDFYFDGRENYNRYNSPEDPIRVPLE